MKLVRVWAGTLLIFCPVSIAASSQLNLSDTDPILSLAELSSLFAKGSNPPPQEDLSDVVRRLLAQLERSQSEQLDEDVFVRVENGGGGTSSKGANYSKGRVWSVIGAAILILALSIFGVFLPDIIKWIMGTTTSEYSSTRIVVESLCNSFAAGGFWGLALIHVLKEAIDHLGHLQWGMNVGTAYCNGAYLLICTGYLVMLMIEAFANTTSQKQRLKRGLLDTQQYSMRDRQKAAILDASVASLALTFHAIFEGMVIGMRPNGVLVWVATTSVAGHKWAEAFALSQRMSSNDLSKSWRTLFLSTFLLSTPVGALLGLPLGAFQGNAVLQGNTLGDMSDSPIGGIMSSLSCGVLVYVAGECTSDIFHSHHGSPFHSMSHQQSFVGRELGTSYSDADVEGDNLSLNKPRAELQDNQANISSIEASYRVLVGRLLLMICGMTLLAGMMFVELKTNSAIVA